MDPWHLLSGWEAGALLATYQNFIRDWILSPYFGAPPVTPAITSTSFEGYQAIEIGSPFEDNPSLSVIIVNLALVVGEQLTAEQITRSPGFTNVGAAGHAFSQTWAEAQAAGSLYLSDYANALQRKMIEFWSAASLSANTYTLDEILTDRLVVQKYKFDATENGNVFPASVTLQQVNNPTEEGYPRETDLPSGAASVVGAGASAVVMLAGTNGIQRALEDIGMSRLDVAINNGNQMYSVVGGTRVG